MKKKILSVVLSVLLLSLFGTEIPVKAGAVYTDGRLQYTLDNGSATIVGYFDSKKATECYVPNQLGGYPVNYIEDNAFYDAQYAKKFYLPDCIMVVGDNAFPPNATVIYQYNITKPASFDGANAVIGEALQLKFSISTTGNPAYAKLKVTQDLVTTELTNPVPTGTENRYAFYYPIDPQDMTDSLQILFTYQGEAIYQTGGFSVKTYADLVYELYPTDAKSLRVIADMLEYGAAAQKYSNHNLLNLANSSAWVSEKSTAFSPVTADSLVTGKGDEGAALESGNLVLTDVVQLRFHGTATDTSNLKVSLYRQTGEKAPVLIKEVPVTEKDFTVLTDGLLFFELGDTYSAVLKRNGEEIQKATYDVKSYVAYWQDKSSPANLSLLVKRLWQYGKSSEAFFK